jgi:hypothetical protein
MSEPFGSGPAGAGASLAYLRRDQKDHDDECEAGSVGVDAGDLNKIA